MKKENLKDVLKVFKVINSCQTIAQIICLQNWLWNNSYLKAKFSKDDRIYCQHLIDDRFRYLAGR